MASHHFQLRFLGTYNRIFSAGAVDAKIASILICGLLHPFNFVYLTYHFFQGRQVTKRMNTTHSYPATASSRATW